MQAEIDLEFLQKNLGREHREAKGLIRQIIGIYAVRLDLMDAKGSLETFWQWGTNAVVPSRSIAGDVGAEGMIGRALFSWAVLRTCRAVDMGSEGRQKIDFYPAFKADGLEGVLEEVVRFRNQELAHYGGLQRGKEKVSDDRAILIIKNDGDTFITSVYRRRNSERDLAIKLASVIECSIKHSASYRQQKQELLLRLLASNCKLREDVLRTIPDCLFIQSAFFRTEFRIAEFQPDGPRLTINW